MRPWTELERESLRIAWVDAGVSRADIAEMLRRSVYAVIHQARDLRLGGKAGGRDKRMWKQAELEELRRLRDESTLTMRQIGARLGRSKNAVINMAKIQHMPRRRPPRKVAQEAEVKPQRDNSALIAALIARGISPETANMLRRRTK